MIEGDPETAAFLPDHGDAEDDWEAVEEALFAEDFDFRLIWLPHFTRVMFGEPGSPYQVWPPFRWWEPDSSPVVDRVVT
ncbi:hypothetical protein [Longimycelium tulufanense]|nr:hypothetical protein [Longimycelium tulufanense]